MHVNDATNTHVDWLWACSMHQMSKLSINYWYYCTKVKLSHHMSVTTFDYYTIRTLIRFSLLQQNYDSKNTIQRSLSASVYIWLMHLFNRYLNQSNVLVYFDIKYFFLEISQAFNWNLPFNLTYVIYMCVYVYIDHMRVPVWWALVTMWNDGS